MKLAQTYVKNNKIVILFEQSIFIYRMLFCRVVLLEHWGKITSHNSTTPCMLKNMASRIGVICWLVQLLKLIVQFSTVGRVYVVKSLTHRQLHLTMFKFSHLFRQHRHMFQVPHMAFNCQVRQGRLKKIQEIQLLQWM